jgi:hypothetical protein
MRWGIPSRLQEINKMYLHGGFRAQGEVKRKGAPEDKKTPGDAPGVPDTD